MLTSIHSNSVSPPASDDFLPPISRWTAFGGLSLVVMISITIALAAVTKYHVAVKASATVRPAGELRVVQSEREGSIQQIEATEHQTVQQGDVIAYLDDSKLQIQKSQLQGSIQQSQLQLSQIEAQVRFLEHQILAESQSVERQIAATHAEKSRNQREYNERRLTTQADFQEALVALELARDEMRRYQQLVEAGAVSVLQFKEKETAVRTAEVKLARAQAGLNPSDAAVTISQEQAAEERARGEATLANLHKEREALSQQRSEIQNQLLRDLKDLEQVNRDLEQSIIRATSDGTIFKLSLLNSQQVVRPGDSIAQIAPTQAPLVVKAMVANQDIDKVAVGQPAQVRIDACPYPDYGTLKGKVTAVAPDVSSGDPSASASTLSTPSASQTGSNGRSFEVTIQPDTDRLISGERHCQIQAGMTATTSIISRQETFLQFVLRKARILTDL